MSELSPGSIFRIGEQKFEYVGLTQTPEGKKVVGRLNPDSPQSEGSLHKTFTPEEIKDGVKEGPFNKDYPYSEYLKEKQIWQTTFGPEIEVPYPPQLLVDTLKRAKEIGINSFEPHFIPEGRISPHEIELNGKNYSYPDSYVRPSSWFFESVRGLEMDPSIQKEKIWDESILNLPGKWILIDNTPKPNYNQIGNQIYDNDPLKNILEEIAPIIKSRINWYLPGARSELNYDDLINTVFPSLLEKLSLSEEVTKNIIAISTPSYPVFNLVANIFYPELKTTTMREWFDDKTIRGRGERTVGGGDSFQYVIPHYQSHQGHGIGFRPMIIFNQQTSP